MDKARLEAGLAQLPLTCCQWLTPGELEFSHRVRWICEHECPMYDKTWACPPAVGSVEECKARCLGYSRCLLIGTTAEDVDPSDMEAALATRPAHERITNQVRDLLREAGERPFVLSTQACAICSRCAWPDGLPCRMPGRMHPCVESHGINLIPTLERLGETFIPGSRLISWYSLLFI